MSLPSKKWFRRALVAILVIVLVLGFRMADRYSDVAALQESMTRNYEITFNSWGKPALLPEFIDQFAKKQIDRKHGATHGTTNLDALTIERFRSMFRGSIWSIEINYPEGFRRGVGDAVAEFPILETLVINDGGTDANSYDDVAVAELFGAIAELGALESLQLNGIWVTSERLTTIGALAELRRLTIGDCDLTLACFEWIRSLPKLESLDLSSAFLDTDALLEFARANPQIKVIHPAP